METIKFDYDGKHYVLCYTRESVRQIEAQGFVLERLKDKPQTMIPLLFYGAFAVHHRGIKRKLVDEIWEKIKGEEILAALIEMYSATISDLLGADDETESPNRIAWERG